MRDRRAWLMCEVIRAPTTTYVGLGTCMCVVCLWIALYLVSLSHGIAYWYRILLTKTVVPFASLASMRQGILIVSFAVRSSHCWQMLSSFPGRGKVSS